MKAVHVARKKDLNLYGYFNGFDNSVMLRFLRESFRNLFDVSAVDSPSRQSFPIR